jgi:hemerythrin HHE cation binding domain-containing protein
MDPVDLLKGDHRAVKGLFRKFEQAGSASEKQKLGEQIIEELSLHAAIEEQLVYPMIRERDRRLVSKVLDAIEEHHAVKLTLAELDKMKADAERYDAKMHVVIESAEMHIEEEERALLPRLAQVLDPDTADKLAKRMLALKQFAPNHPHPAAPDTPPAGLVTGVIAKLSDVGKDLVRRFSNHDQAEGHRQVRERAKAARAEAADKPRRTTARPATRKSTKKHTAFRRRSR